MTEGTKYRGTLLVLCNALILAAASPVFMPQFLPGGTGRNIRHLPCVSRRTGETGVCMFAFTCVKANGTHLGTCIDRFYFGSCCKIEGEPDIFPHDNTIDDGPVKPYPTNHGSIESNNIPEYSPKPTSTATKSPVRITEAPVKTTQTPTTTQKPVKVVEKPLLATTVASVSKPAKVTVNTTNKRTTTPVPDFTTDPVGLSTFQTVQNNPPKTSSTPRPTPGATSKPPQKISTTVPGTTSGKPGTVNKPTLADKPSRRPVTQNGTKIEVKPISKPPVTKPPVTKPVVKPSSAKPPVLTSTVQSVGSTPTKTRTTTAKPIASPATRPVTNATRFPPRNATTTTTTTTTPRPPRPSSNRRPISTTTKKPTSAPIKRFNTTTTASPTVNRRPLPSLGSVTPASRPTTVAETVSVTTPVGDLLTTKVPTTPSISEGGKKPASPGQRPSITETKPTTATTPVVNKQTTKQPPRPSSRPTATPPTSSVVGDSSRPTGTVKPPATKPKPITTQVHETSTTTSPLKKPTPTSTTVSSATSPATKRPTTPSSTQSTPSSTSTSLSTSTISNEVIPLNDTENKTPGYDASKVESTSSSPGLVTWTSNSDDVTTKSPPIPTVTSESEEPTNTEWTPITTPDGWILIQSPSPNESSENEDTFTIRPITQSTVFDKPVLSSTTERSTARPSLPTVATMPTTTDNFIPTAEMNMSDYKQVCGRRLFPESRIVGGSRSAFGKWPWQISLRQWRTSTYLHKCGAALLNENWAITAAHCVANVPASDLLLRLGEHDLASEDEPYGFQERRVQLSALHPQFDPRTFEYDLALLRFYEPLLPFQPNTLPICLPDDDESYVGLTAHVTGWGRLWDDGPLPSVLQEVPVRIINNTVCEEMYRTAGYIEYIPNIFICAGWRKGGRDSCEGDSGGPLVIQRPKDKRWILAGVISWGIGCAEPNQPGVYTRISEFREWINQILQF